MYWRDHDITFKAADVGWAGLRPSVDSLAPDITDSDYIEADVSVTAAITPTLTFEKTINLFGEQTLSPYIVYPLMIIGLNDADTLQPIITADTPLLKLLVEQMLNPVTTKSAYIESETVASTTLYPAILTDILDLSVHVDETLLITVGTLNLFAYIFGDDNIAPVFIDDAISVILQETILKRLDNSWAEATIYMKESDGTWTSKPIYMKQIDKSWM